MRSQEFSFYRKKCKLKVKRYKENSSSKSASALMDNNYSWLHLWTYGWVCLQKCYFNNWKSRGPEKKSEKLACHPGFEPEWLDCKNNQQSLGKETSHNIGPAYVCKGTTPQKIYVLEGGRNKRGFEQFTWCPRVRQCGLVCFTEVPNCPVIWFISCQRCPKDT